MIEERRMQTDSNPVGRLLEQFTTAAFQAHPYHRPTVGWMADLNSFSATDAQHFFDEYYIPSNMIVAVVGDVKASEAIPVIEKYFGQIPSREKPDERTTTEPPQNSERRVVMYDRSQPLYLEGYHRPDYRSPDDAVYDAIADLMSNGRTSRLYRASVRDKKIAAYSAGFTGLPGIKYAHLFAFYAFPLPGHKPEEMADAIHAEIDRLKTEDITDEELKMIRTRAKANLLRGLDSNEGLASDLALYQARYGDWRELSHQVDNLDKVTKADIRRVANQTFFPTNRTVGISRPLRRVNPPAKMEVGNEPRDRIEKPFAIVLILAVVSFSGTPQAAAQTPEWQQIPIPPLPAFHPQEPERIALPNGMVIFLQEDHELPLIDGVARIRGGSRSEPAAKIGLLDLYGEVWRTGAPRLRPATNSTTILKSGRRRSRPATVSIPRPSPSPV